LGGARDKTVTRGTRHQTCTGLAPREPAARRSTQYL